MPQAMVITQKERNSKRVDLRRLPVLAKRRVNDAQLPELYLTARAALRECARIDEVKDIKDKHDALAHYAKQAKDKSLMYYAERIKLRAFERIGQLLNDVPDNIYVTAKKNGIAYNHAQWSSNLAQIPKRVRDKLIEQDPPPKIKTLSDYGLDYIPQTTFRSVPSRSNFGRHAGIERRRIKSPEQRAEMLFDLLVAVNNDLEEIINNKANELFAMRVIARSVKPDDVAAFKKLLRPITERLDEFEQFLIGGH